MGTKDVFIFELSQSSFTASAVENSYKLPVIVEFMGVWSEPCIRLADSLSVLAREFAGQFIFAKVDVDEQPELSQQYGIENVPSLLVLKDGKVINTLDGLVKESELRELLKSLGIYNQSDELRLQAREKHLAGYTVEAIQLLTQAIQQDPANSRVAMDMVQVMIDIGELEQATGLFNRLPDSEKESEFGRALIGQLSFMELASNTAGKEALISHLASNETDQDARFDLAICYIAAHQYELAAEALFNIMKVEPEYKDGAAREMIGNLANMLSASSPELSAVIRRQLANLMAP